MEANEVWKVGDRIQYNSSMQWRDEEGTHHDSYTIEARIVRIEANCAYWQMERVVLLHKGNPHTDIGRLLPKSGGFNTAFKIPYIKRIPEPPEPLPLWRQEFGEAYMVPPEITEAVLEGELFDTSWHNDTSPSFVGLSGRYTLWTDHPIRDQREMEGDRYCVVLNTYHEDSDGSEYKVFYSGDSIKDALAKLQELEDAEPRKVKDDLIEEFTRKLLEATEFFSGADSKGVEECLRLYRDYREANSYQKVPIGLEGLTF